MRRILLYQLTVTLVIDFEDETTGHTHTQVLVLYTNQDKVHSSVESSGSGFTFFVFVFLSDSDFCYGFTSLSTILFFILFFAFLTNWSSLC